jgi:hypothetical protein
MAEFVGKRGVEHVRQPEGSEQCFAAIVASVTRLDLNTAHEALTSHEISEANGTTGVPLPEIEVPVGNRTLSISPLGSMTSAPKLLARINERWESGDAIALLYKKVEDESDERHHWALLTGKYQSAGIIVAVQAMDPLKENLELIKPGEVIERIDRTIEYGGGVFAYALRSIN